MTSVDPNVSVFGQAWSDITRKFKGVMIGVVLVTLVAGAAGGIWVPREETALAKRILIGLVSAVIALAALTAVLYLAFLLAAPIRQRNAARKLLREREEEIARLKTPKPEPLLLVRVPRNPRSGHIDGFDTVHFEQVLVTDLSGESRPLRFHLSMRDREFLDFGEFQEIYQERAAIHASYLSNPLDLAGNGNRQGSLAFIHKEGSSGLADSWELTVEDVRSRAVLTISTPAEYTLNAS